MGAEPVRGPETDCARDCNVVIAVALGPACRSEHQNLPTHISELNHHNQSLQLCGSGGND
jgi:hypothetical protein